MARSARVALAWPALVPGGLTEEIVIYRALSEPKARLERL